MRVDPSVREILDRLGFLNAGPTTRFATCPECEDGHVEEYEALPNAQDEKTFFIPCPVHERVEVDRKSLMQTTISFQPLVDLLADGFDVNGNVQEIVPGRLWNVGRATLVGQSRPVWMARGLCLRDSLDWACKLPTGKSPVVFVAGTQPSLSLHPLSPGQIIELHSVVSLDENRLTLNIEAVRNHLAREAPQVVKKNPTRKRSKRAGTIDALKRELHAYILGMKNRISLTEDSEDPFGLPHLTQKALADLIGDNETNVSRALNDPNERELAILYETANNWEMIRKYSR